MGKRHNRKRTRSRPRQRDTNNITNNNMHSQLQHHTRSVSVSTTTSLSTTSSSLPTSAPAPPHPAFHPPTPFPPPHWQHTHLSYQTRHLHLLEQRERDQEVALQRLRIFGGTLGDETTLLEPMLKVVTDLFDGFTDYVDP
jgi:hypothetical protein